MISKITEREVAADLTAELDNLIKQGGTPFQKATVEHQAGGRYPDIVIWTDYTTHQAFAFWELKAPGLPEDTSKLPQKAQNLGVRYVVVWNLLYGELYEITNGQLLPRKSYPTPFLNSFEEWAIPPKRFPVIEQAQKILDDLSRLAQGQSLTPFVPDKFYFIGILQKAITKLLPALQDHLFQKKKDKIARNQIDAWAVKQSYPTSLPNLDELLARHWAYALAVRFLFYFTVRRYYPSLPDLKPMPGSAQAVADLINDAFSKEKAVDWQAVFEPSPLDKLGLPQTVGPILRELLDEFHRYDLSQLREDVIGQILEGLIPEKERHALGQYFTREDLVDFIIGFVADRDDAFYLDPTCGSGTFLNRLYSRLRWLSSYRATHAQFLERLWGVDIAHFPAELATINLFRQDVKDLSNFPRIIVRDFFEMQPGQVFSFPPLKITAPDYLKIQVAMHTSHGIVGNFPYIRQELIERQNRGYKREIVQAIALEWFWKDQELFTVKGIPSTDIGTVATKDAGERQKWLQQQVQAGRTDLRLSGQADIYAYLFYHAAAFLEEGGRLGIVTSNAWLDVAYGEELKRFFLRHFKIIAVVASWAEPWFEDAAINTAFTILERCEDPAQRAQNIACFVKVQKPLSEFLPRDLLLREAERWQKVDALVRSIETAADNIMKWDPATGQIQPIRGVHTLEQGNLRIRLVPQAELEAELQAKGPTAKWGLYIRAPQVYFDLLQRAGDKFVPLSQIAEVRFGIKTGINDFFYLQPLGPESNAGTLRVRNARGWVGEIESACLRPVIKSPKEAKGLVVDAADLQYRLFLPPVREVQAEENEPSQANLEKELLSAYPLAHAYVKWGEQQRTAEGQPWPQVPSVQGRKAWWLLGSPARFDFLISRFVDKRFFIPAAERLEVADTFFVGEVEETENAKILTALLNSSLYALEIEIKGRVNLGDGLLTFYGPDIDATFVPRVDGFSSHSQQSILDAYGKLTKRPVKPIAQEVRQKDRQALDATVLEALGLDPARYQKRIYEGLVEMVEERLALPQLRATRKKSEKRLSLEQVKEHVLKDVLPSGLKSITAFLPVGHRAMLSIPVTGRPVTWRPFLTQFTLLDAAGNEVGMLTGDELQARYAIYVARHGQYMLEVPADTIVASKTVQEYEHYLFQIGQDIFQRALEATRDYQRAEQVTREILESLGLPPLSVNKAMGG